MEQWVSGVWNGPLQSAAVPVEPLLASLYYLEKTDKSLWKYLALTGLAHTLLPLVTHSQKPHNMPVVIEKSFLFPLSPVLRDRICRMRRHVQ